MSERAYSIQIKLDGTRLCVSLIEDDGEGGGWEVSSDNVDLAPMLEEYARAFLATMEPPK